MNNAQALFSHGMLDKTHLQHAQGLVPTVPQHHTQLLGSSLRCTGHMQGLLVLASLKKATRLMSSMQVVK
jgi:hypothetical protein